MEQAVEFENVACLQTFVCAGRHGFEKAEFSTI